MSELSNQNWCVEHYLYFYEDEGCPTCQYEDDLEDCDGCSEAFQVDELTEDESAGLKFCNNCQEENKNN